MDIEIILLLLGGLFLLIGVFLLVLGFVEGKKCHNPPIKKDTSHHFAILIPARDESLVIRDLLESIKNQTLSVPMEDVYVIVESMDDPTVLIATSFSSTVVVRKELTKQRKGYALDEAVQFILSQQKKYDAYFIFDADNILEPTYLEKMAHVYDQGYDIGVGYRNCKNGDASVIAACSALTFSMINTLGNKSKKKHTGTVTISGTGFYLRGYLIDKWRGYPFHTLTEDYELTLYATLHHLTTDYSEEAIFYDEQPVQYAATVPQRVRWIKGYFTSRKLYLKKIKKKLKRKNSNYGALLQAYLGVKPYLCLVIGCVLLLLSQVISLLLGIKKDIFFLLFLIIMIDIILMMVTFLMIQREKGKLCLSRKRKIQALLLNPFFLISYVPCALRALFQKDVAWTKVEHGKSRL